MANSDREELEKALLLVFFVNNAQNIEILEKRVATSEQKEATALRRVNECEEQVIFTFFFFLQVDVL